MNTGYVVYRNSIATGLAKPRQTAPNRQCGGLAQLVATLVGSTKLLYAVQLPLREIYLRITNHPG